MKIKLVLIVLIALFILLVCISLQAGALYLSVQDIFRIILGTQNDHAYLLLNIRVPRILFALLAGALMAVAGTSMQGLFRNPLADPGLMGISSGASLAAAAYMTLYPFLQSVSFPLELGLIIFPCVGAALITLLVSALAKTRGQTDMKSLLLSGMVANAIAGAGTAFVIYLANTEQLRNITFWMMGSLAQGSWTSVTILLCSSVPGALLLLRISGHLNVLALGETQASAMGVHTEKLKFFIIWCTALVMGPVVALSGVIGFVGLIVPHILREAGMADHKYLMPLSALGGACLLLLADTVSRTIVLPSELPVGILTALCGGPLFLYILYKNRPVRDHV